MKKRRSWTLFYFRLKIFFGWTTVIAGMLLLLNIFGFPSWKINQLGLIFGISAGGWVVSEILFTVRVNKKYAGVLMWKDYRKMKKRQQEQQFETQFSHT